MEFNFIVYALLIVITIELRRMVLEENCLWYLILLLL